MYNNKTIKNKNNSKNFKWLNINLQTSYTGVIHFNLGSLLA